MPRQPTGNPRGRPRGSGSGVGDEAPRLTVRLPTDLYARLEAFAESYKYHRGDPPLSVCVREMVAFCLKHPGLFRQTDTVPGPGGNSRQTDTVPGPGGNSRQTENVPVPAETMGDSIRQTESDNSRQTINVPAPPSAPGEPSRQTKNVPVYAESMGDSIRQTDNVAALAPGETSRQTEIGPPFDTTKFYLGKLCPRGHAYQDTGQSLRYLPSTTRGNCRDCTVEQSRERRQKAASREGSHRAHAQAGAPVRGGHFRKRMDNLCIWHE